MAGYDPAWCEQLYERRQIFEAQNKGLSFVPTSEYPWFRGTSSRQATRLLAENPDVAERVLERIRAEGPLSSADFERAQGATTDWFGMPTNTVRAVLEASTVTGVLGLARREGNRRYYDLLERLLPADVLAREILCTSSSATSSSRATAPTGSSASAAAATSSAASALPSPTRSDPRIQAGLHCARS